MNSRTEREKAIEHGERQRRKRLDRKNLRERARRRIDKFHLSLVYQTNC